jgi:hypothetical protein
MTDQLSSETLMAYADGAVSEAQAKEIKAIAAADPEIADEIALYRVSRERLETGFDALLHEDVPPHLIAIMRVQTGDENSESKIVALPKRKRDFKFYSPKLAMAAAALLSVGVMATTYMVKLDNTDPSGSLIMHASMINDTHPLAHALQQSIGGSAVEINENMTARAIVSYRLADGQLCREFEIVAPSAASVGIACRVETGWEIEVQTAAMVSAKGQNEMATASGENSEVMAQTLERLGVGIGLDAQQEACAAAEGWTQLPAECPASTTK